MYSMLFFLFRSICSLPWLPGSCRLLLLPVCMMSVRLVIQAIVPVWSSMPRPAKTRVATLTAGGTDVPECRKSSFHTLCKLREDSVLIMTSLCTLKFFKSRIQMYLRRLWGGETCCFSCFLMSVTDKVLCGSYWNCCCFNQLLRYLFPSFAASIVNEHGILWKHFNCCNTQ